ncbi:MAG: secretin N-terminal domain-containing protein [Burkholderiales bacterium]
MPPLEESRERDPGRRRLSDRNPWTRSALAALALVVACAESPVKRADELAAQDEWLKVVLEYRKALADSPADIEFRSRLRQAELKAADFYYQRGTRLLEQNNLDGAIVQFQQGLASMPDHSKLQQAMTEVIARKEGASLFREGLNLRDAGQLEEARRQFERTLDVYPGHKQAAAALAELKKEYEEKVSEGLALTSKAPITLNFRQTDLRQAFEFLAKSFGVNVIFDESVKSVPVTLFAKDITFEQGLNLLLTTSKTFSKRIGANTILIAPDSKDKRGQYEDHLVRTFHMNSVRAKEVADMLKGLVTIKKIIINEQLNTITIRDTEDVIRLVQRIIENNDRKPAEMVLDVEILEVNRSKSEKLGLDFGTYAFTAAVPAPGTVPLDSIRSTVRASATLTIPPVTFRFFKQDVDAKILANPKIRVINGKIAKIHIGDRVPLRAATIVDATGQTRTTFDYKDIGIRLTFEPTIYLDNSALVKLGLEVSALGANIGSATEPAFSIGTRNAETFMLLRDGETAILGGLIQDEERNTRVKLPGLGDIPVVGSLFTSFDDSANRTDVLLTVTPRVVRGWDVPTRVAREFYSGSENVYSDKPLFAGLDIAPGAQIRTEAAGAAVPAVAGVSGAGTPAATAVASAPAGAPGLPGSPAAGPVAAGLSASPLLSFSEPVYEVASGQDFEIKVLGANLSGAASVPLEILYNPQLLRYVSGARGEVPVDSFNSSADASRGALSVSLSLSGNAGPSGSAVLARVVMRGDKPGISYLVYRTPAIKSASGEILNAQVRAARVVIK